MTDKTSWSAMAKKELCGKPLGSLTWDTLEGIDVQPIYTADDVAGLSFIHIRRCRRRDRCRSKCSLYRDSKQY